MRYWTTNTNHFSELHRKALMDSLLILQTDYVLYKLYTVQSKTSKQSLYASHVLWYTDKLDHDLWFVWLVYVVLYILYCMHHCMSYILHKKENDCLVWTQQNSARHRHKFQLVLSHSLFRVHYIRFRCDLIY